MKMPNPIATIVRRVGGVPVKKEPLKESGYEMYVRIQKENEQKEKRKSDRAIKKLKQEGKVQSIAGFLICKEEDKEETD